MDAVEQFVDRPSRKPRCQQRPDMTNLTSHGRVEQSLPRRRTFGFDKPLVLVIPQHPWSRAGAGRQIADAEQPRTVLTCLCH